MDSLAEQLLDDSFNVLQYVDQVSSGQENGGMDFDQLLDQLTKLDTSTSSYQAKKESQALNASSFDSYPLYTYSDSKGTLPSLQSNQTLASALTKAKSNSARSTPNSSCATYESASVTSYVSSDRSSHYDQSTERQPATYDRFSILANSLSLPSPAGRQPRLGSSDYDNMHQLPARHRMTMSSRQALEITKNLNLDQISPQEESNVTDFSQMALLDDSMADETGNSKGLVTAPVLCPICNLRFALESTVYQINRHVDLCIASSDNNDMGSATKSLYATNGEEEDDVIEEDDDEFDEEYVMLATRKSVQLPLPPPAVESADQSTKPDTSNNVWSFFDYKNEIEQIRHTLLVLDSAYGGWVNYSTSKHYRLMIRKEPQEGDFISLRASSRAKYGFKKTASEMISLVYDRHLMTNFSKSFRIQENVLHKFDDNCSFVHTMVDPPIVKPRDMTAMWYHGVFDASRQSTFVCFKSLDRNHPPSEGFNRVQCLESAFIFTPVDATSCACTIILRVDAQAFVPKSVLNKLVKGLFTHLQRVANSKTSVASVKSERVDSDSSDTSNLHSTKSRKNMFSALLPKTKSSKDGDSASTSSTSSKDSKDSFSSRPVPSSPLRTSRSKTFDSLRWKSAHIPMDSTDSFEKYHTSPTSSTATFSTFKPRKQSFSKRSSSVVLGQNRLRQSIDTTSSFSTDRSPAYTASQSTSMNATEFKRQVSSYQTSERVENVYLNPSHSIGRFPNTSVGIVPGSASLFIPGRAPTLSGVLPDTAVQAIRKMEADQLSKHSSINSQETNDNSENMTVEEFQQYTQQIDAGNRTENVYFQTSSTKLNAVDSANDPKQQSTGVFEIPPAQSISTFDQKLVQNLIRKRKRVRLLLNTCLHQQYDKQDEESIDSRTMPFGRRIPFKLLEFLDVVGKGMSGVVYKAVYEGTLVAVKQFSKGKESDNNSDSNMKEVQMLSEIKPHSNIVLFLGIVQNPMCAVIEYLDRSLESVIDDPIERLSISSKVYILIGVARGLAYLHDVGIVHRDLASRNILLKSNKFGWKAKLTDFGLSTKLQPDQTKVIELDLIAPGKILAPECLKHGEYSRMTDVWAFGLLMAELYTRQEPYGRMTTEAVVQGVLDGTLSHPLPAKCPQECLILLKQCIERESCDRPQMSECLEQLNNFWQQLHGKILSSSTSDYKT